MLPCSKMVNGAYAARYLKLAERNARSIKVKTGVKRTALDGCIIEGKRSGSLLKATVIEPLSEILSIAGNRNPPPDDSYIHKVDFLTYPCGTREPFHPEESPVRPPAADLDTVRQPLYTGGATFGRDMPTENQGLSVFNSMIPPVYVWSSESTHYAVHYIYDRTAQSQYYLRVTATKSGASALGKHDGTAAFIHEDRLKQITGDYGMSTMPYYARRAKAVEISEGVIVAVATVGKVIDSLPPTQVGGATSAVTLYRESLVRLNIDLKIKENAAKKKELGNEYDPVLDKIEPVLTGSLFPKYLIPAELQPSTVLRWREDDSQVFDSVPAKTAMTIADLEVTESGDVVAAIKYQVKVQEGVEPNNPYFSNPRGEEGTTVIASGLASWGGNNQFFNIHSKEVITGDGNSPLITTHGADPGFVLLDNSTNIIDSKCVRTAARLSREAMYHLHYTSNPQYMFQDPYLVEIVDGIVRPRQAGDPVMGIAYGGRGLQYAYGFSVDFERDFYLHSNWVREVNNGNKARVSETAVAVPASGGITPMTQAFIKSADQGVMFIDGEKRRYERVSGAPNNVEQQHITITCHQQEVRNADGRLTSPSVLIVGAYINGKHSICIRKGPIWEEDFDDVGYSFERYWKVTEAINKNFNFYFYIGNKLMDGKYRKFFVQEKAV